MLRRSINSTRTLIQRRCMSLPSTPGETERVSHNTGMGTPKFRPSNYHKFILVLTKKFKTKEEIPDLVSHELIEKASSQARIKLANYLMILTALGSLTAILLGKSAAKRGESVHKMNQDFHKKYQEEYNSTHSSTTK